MLAYTAWNGRRLERREMRGTSGFLFGFAFSLTFIALGALVALALASCGDLGGDALAACVFQPGHAEVTAVSSEGTAQTRAGGVELTAEGPGDCSRFAILGRSVAAQIRCDHGHPVKHCALSGACVDEKTGRLFACQGDLWFD